MSSTPSLFDAPSIRRAQVQWAAQDTARRAACFQALGRVLLAAAQNEADAVAGEAGKGRFESASLELLPLLEVARYLAHRGCARVEREAPLPVRVAPHKKSVLVQRARGVVGIIAPGNVRFAIAGSEVLFALCAKNAVVLKPAPRASASAHRLAAWLKRAGFPPGLLTVIDDDDASGRALVQADVDYITFVGSSVAGRAVATACIARDLPFRTETGGKAAAVVLQDAPLRRTAAALLWGAFCHDGQICAGVQRVFVDSAIIEPLLAALRDEVKHVAFRPGENDIRTALDALSAPFVDDALAHGASVVLDVDGRQVLQYVPPALDRAAGASADQGSCHLSSGDAPRIFREECFAPVLALCPLETNGAMVAAANAGPGDLIAYVFGPPRTAEAVARQISAGTVMVNDVLWSYGMPEAPWHGVRKSGHGVTHGEAGLLDYMRTTHVVSPRGPTPTRDPYWYPYTPARLVALEAGLRVLYGRGSERVASTRRALGQVVRGALGRSGRRNDRSPSDIDEENP